MTITEDDLAGALRILHDDTHPMRQPGEFTIMEYWAANRDKLSSRERAEKELQYLWRSGKILKPPHRFIDKKMTVVYKMIAEDHQK